MKKKIISLMLTAAMTVSLLAGCGNSGNSASTSANAQSGTSTQGSAQNSTPTPSDNTASDTGNASGEAFREHRSTTADRLYSRLLLKVSFRAYQTVP